MSIRVIEKWLSHTPTRGVEAPVRDINADIGKGELGRRDPLDSAFPNHEDRGVATT